MSTGNMDSGDWQEGAGVFASRIAGRHTSLARRVAGYGPSLVKKASVGTVQGTLGLASKVFRRAIWGQALAGRVALLSSRISRFIEPGQGHYERYAMPLPGEDVGGQSEDSLSYPEFWTGPAKSDGPEEASISPARPPGIGSHETEHRPAGQQASPLSGKSRPAASPDGLPASVQRTPAHGRGRPLSKVEEGPFEARPLPERRPVPPSTHVPTPDIQSAQEVSAPQQDAEEQPTIQDTTRPHYVNRIEPAFTVPKKADTVDKPSVVRESPGKQSHGPGLIPVSRKSFPSSAARFVKSIAGKFVPEKHPVAQREEISPSHPAPLAHSPAKHFVQREVLPGATADTQEEARSIPGAEGTTTAPGAVQPVPIDTPQGEPEALPPAYPAVVPAPMKDKPEQTGRSSKSLHTITGALARPILSRAARAPISRKFVPRLAARYTHQTVPDQQTISQPPTLTPPWPRTVSRKAAAFDVEAPAAGSPLQEQSGIASGEPEAEVAFTRPSEPGLPAGTAKTPFIEETGVASAARSETEAFDSHRVSRMPEIEDRPDVAFERVTSPSPERPSLPGPSGKGEYGSVKKGMILRAAVQPDKARSKAASRQAPDGPQSMPFPFPASPPDIVQRAPETFEPELMPVSESLPEERSRQASGPVRVQRAEAAETEETGQTEQTQRTEARTGEYEKIAREVYTMIKGMLAIERERAGLR